MSFASNAVLAKARYLYGNRLKEADYDDLLKRKDIKDVVSYLRTSKNYMTIFQDIKEDLHRGDIETLLNEDTFIRAAGLMRYASVKDLPFYQCQAIKVEIQLLVQKGMWLNSRRKGYHIPVPEALKKYARFSLEDYLRAKTYQELLDVVKGTIYEDVLKAHQPPVSAPIDMNALELDLKKLYYRTVKATIQKHFRGRKARELLMIYQTELELDNITKIYRAKKYFHRSNEEILDLLILEDTRIPSKELTRLLDAPDAAAFMQELTASSYHVMTGEKNFVYIEYYVDQVQYHLAKRYIHFSHDPAVIYTVYLILHMIEIANLKHIIEGIRYHEDPAEIKKMLIYE